MTAPAVAADPAAPREAKVALVSGVGPGLGRATCTRLARDGWRVVAGDRDQGAVDDTVASVRAADGEITGLVGDIRDRASCDALVGHALATFGRLDALVNDAYHGGDFTPFAHADLDRWRATSDVNVFGTLTITQAALDALRTARGAVVNVCTHGVEVIQPGFGAYASSKAALAQLTKQLAAELGRDGVRVNAVFPGPMWGSAMQGFLDAQARARGVEPQIVYDEFTSRNAYGRFVTTEEVAALVAFLCSDTSSALTGQALYADGGEHFH